MLLGLCGYARSGKDSTADILVRRYGFVKVGFADALRALAEKVDPFVSFDVAVSDDGPAVFEPQRYSETLRRRGYEGAKLRHDEVRAFLQRLGVGVRDVLGSQVWVEALGCKVAPLLSARCHVAITDVRFPNEADFVRAWGADIAGVRSELWRITRPGVGPANAHESETNHERFTVDREIVAANLTELETTVVSAWEAMSA